jgi:hypothetical protein
MTRLMEEIDAADSASPILQYHSDEGQLNEVCIVCSKALLRYGAWQGGPQCLVFEESLVFVKRSTVLTEYVTLKKVYSAYRVCNA